MRAGSLRRCRVSFTAAVGCDVICQTERVALHFDSGAVLKLQPVPSAQTDRLDHNTFLASKRRLRPFVSNNANVRIGWVDEHVVCVCC